MIKEIVFSTIQTGWTLNIFLPLNLFYRGLGRGREFGWHQKQPMEMFCKNMFLKISQDSQKNTCARFFFNKVAGVNFSCEFCERAPILKNSSGRLLLWHVPSKVFSMHLNSLIRTLVYLFHWHPCYRCSWISAFSQWLPTWNLEKSLSWKQCRSKILRGSWWWHLVVL